MLRLIIVISLILLSLTGGYYLWTQSSEVTGQARPEISEVKKAAIAKREEQQVNEAEEDAKHEDNVLKLEQSIK